jgi:signal peptidase II
MKVPWRLTAAMSVIAATIGCDRATKQAAERALKGTATHSFLADTVRLQYAENRGGFLSLGAEWPEPLRFGLFALGNAALLAFIGIALARSRDRPAGEQAAWCLLLAGGLSNLLDRVARGGAVVDFLNVGVGALRTGIFNVADLAITIGIVLLVVGYWRQRPTLAPLA